MELTARELQLNNLMIDYLGVVKPISHEDIFKFCNSSFNDDILKPVIITQELAIKYFNPESPLNFSFYVGKLKIWFDMDNGDCWLVRNREHFKVRYFHELQNYYFTFEKEELTFK